MNGNMQVEMMSTRLIYLCISDPSIRALILNIDSRTHDIIIEVSEKVVYVNSLVLTC